jgi:hypothetical protein
VVFKTETFVYITKEQKMEEAAQLSVSQFTRDIGEELRHEKSRGVRALMITYRCVLVLCVLCMTQFTLSFVASVMRENDLNSMLQNFISNISKPIVTVKEKN